MSIQAMERGFADPVHESQRVFRMALDAMARPGRITRLTSLLAPPSPLFGTSASLLLALADFETAIWLDDALADGHAVGEFIRFHTGARLTRERHEANFAIIANSSRIPPLASFAQGTPEYPDRSTTLIIQVNTLDDLGWKLSGPGIRGLASFSATPLPHDFPHQLTANRAQFPLGVDLIFVTPSEIAAVPRSTKIIEGA
jgi:alpha-D-ribose 1-methylphosphonate 5-triphosphate synthase subunit PhnH